MADAADVAQVSVPVRIALVAVLAIAALWFVALRPKPVEEAAAPPATAQPAAPASGLAGAVDKANGAAAASDAANARLQQATGEQTAQGAQGADGAAAAKPAATPSKAATATGRRDLAAPLVRSLRNGRAVVLLFAAKGADDRAAKAAVRAVDRRDGRVRVEVASIADVARYEAITTGVQVTQAPTTLVIGPDRQATVITGYTDAAEVSQAVGDALAGGSKAKK